MRALVSVLLLCMALIACGESTEEEYKDRFPQIDRGLVALGQDIERGLREARDRDLAVRFDGYARRLRALRGRLDELEPPDAVAGEHDALLAAMAPGRAVLSDIAAAARAGDAAAAGSAATRLVRAGAALERARAQLAREVRGL